MNKEYPQVTYSEALHYVNIVKKQPRDIVILLQNILRQRIIEAGYVSDDVLGLVDGMTERFVEEDKKERRKLMEAELRRTGLMAQEKIYADDHKIIQAIKETLPKFKSDWDWGGIYRILVDFCDFDSVKTQFTKRFWQMGIYATDNPVCVKGLKKEIPTAIYRESYCDHFFSYQAIQKGCPTSWPKTYFEWQKIESSDIDFYNRKRIADIFLASLRKAANM